MKQVVVSGSFDDLRSDDMRLLHEASRFGKLHVLLWDDASIQAVGREAPKFPEDERLYFVDAIRYVDRVSLVRVGTPDALPLDMIEQGSIWVVGESQAAEQKANFCAEHGVECMVIPDYQLEGFPDPLDAAAAAPSSGARKVIVTGCYDWFHSGHVRFFEEVSELGELHVVVGHDANIELLKGAGHPMYKEDQRCYMAGSIRFVHRAYVSSGHGWLDAEPEIERIKPDIYAVNEDGDKPEKRDYCDAHGIEYHVLRRAPKPGLPKRQSTDLRGF